MFKGGRNLWWAVAFILPAFSIFFDIAASNSARYFCIRVSACTGAHPLCPLCLCGSTSFKPKWAVFNPLNQFLIVHYIALFELKQGFRLLKARESVV